MLKITNAKYTPACGTNSGGISRVWNFDPADMDFTYTPGTGYTAVGLVAGATVLGGSGFFPIAFNQYEADYKGPQTIKGTSVKYAHALSLQVSFIGQKLTDFLEKMDTASSCYGVGFVIEFNNGTIIVVGENVVDGASIPLWRMRHDGSDTDSGKAFDDNNGGTLMFKGDYSRPAREFTGGVTAIIALENNA